MEGFGKIIFVFVENYYSYFTFAGGVVCYIFYIARRPASVALFLIAIPGFFVDVLLVLALSFSYVSVMMSDAFHKGIIVLIPMIAIVFLYIRIFGFIFNLIPFSYAVRGLSQLKNGTLRIDPGNNWSNWSVFEAITILISYPATQLLVRGIDQSGV
jgi:hypothetical protein